MIQVSSGQEDVNHSGLMAPVGTSTSQHDVYLGLIKSNWEVNTKKISN